jgi:hypothetical protein
MESCMRSCMRGGIIRYFLTPRAGEERDIASSPDWLCAQIVAAEAGKAGAEIAAGAGGEAAAIAVRRGAEEGEARAAAATAAAAEEEEAAVAKAEKNRLKREAAARAHGPRQVTFSV